MVMLYCVCSSCQPGHRLPVYSLRDTSQHLSVTKRSLKCSNHSRLESAVENGKTNVTTIATPQSLLLYIGLPFSDSNDCEYSSDDHVITTINIRRPTAGAFNVRHLVRPISST